MVVQRDGGAGPQQEHPHAERLRLADVHVRDRGALEPRRPGAALAPAGIELQVRGPDGGHQGEQLVRRRSVVPVGRRLHAPEGHVCLLGYSLDEGGFVVPRHSNGYQSVDGSGPKEAPFQRLFSPRMSRGGGRSEVRKKLHWIPEETGIKLYLKRSYFSATTHSTVSSPLRPPSENLRAERKAFWET